MTFYVPNMIVKAIGIKEMGHHVSMPSSIISFWKKLQAYMYHQLPE
jgi:hypothetical protein